MQTIFILILVLSFAWQGQSTSNQEALDCDGNRFEYISTYSLGRQLDMNYTFGNITTMFKVENVSYKDEVYRTYKIYNFKHTLSYSEGKQTALINGINVLRVTGGTLRVTYVFQWEKVQLGSSIKGNGTGSVTSNVLTYEKTLETNETRELQWYLSMSKPVNISNGLTLSTVFPYKLADYDILNAMLNSLKNNETTVKENLLKGINLHFQDTLKEVVKSDPTLKIPKVILYSYSDYRGEIVINFTNTLKTSALSSTGLNLLLSQSIYNYSRWECGETVPNAPSDPSVFGGEQEFLSNSFLKSTVKYAIERGFLDVTLEQKFWQSRAFQFRMGDIHEVISATKNIDSMENITGRCTALNDSTFNFSYKSASSYQVVVNFTCDLFYNKTRLITMILPVTYELKPKLNSKSLDFLLVSLEGTPKFIEAPNYTISNMDLANFMVAETLQTAVGTNLLGSGYKAKNRKNPNLIVYKTYLFLSDLAEKTNLEINDL